MMSHEHELERLSAYMDGDLTADEAAAVEAHVADCGDCALVLDELREVVTLARGLEPSHPESDLWPGIEERLGPRSARVPRQDAPLRMRARPSLMGRSRAPGRRVVFTVPQLAAAGIALVILSASVMWAVLGGLGPDPSPSMASGAPLPGAVMVSYEAAIQDLETEFQSRRESLDPATIRVVEQNLAIIDQAIEEARRALETDPASGYLNGYLTETMQRKVDLLRQATRIQQTET